MLRLLLFLITAISFCGCGTSDNSESKGRGAINYKIVWTVDSKISAKQASLVVVDMPSEVITVRAVVRGPYMNPMQKDYPASAHNGSLVSVPTGENRSIVMLGLDASGRVIYRGSISRIKVVTDQVTDAGTLEMQRYTSPTADAGADQVVVVGARVSLTGSGSKSDNGETLTYTWTIAEKPSSSTATLSDPGSVQPMFDADENGRYVATLIVTDSSGVVTSTASVTITALPDAAPLVLDGYMDKFSYNPGETAKIYINATDTTKAAMTLYDILGNKVDTVAADFRPQQAATPNPSSDGFGYSQTAAYIIPSLKSGLYLWENKIPFLIKDQTKQADIVVLYPSNTENAYNAAGGLSLYSLPVPAPIVSFLRPAAYPIAPLAESFMKWFPSYNTRTVSYISDQDMDDYHEIENAKVVIIVGHSEYWTRSARLNLDKFVDSGKSALILSGDTMWWQARYSEDRTKLICYKNVPDPVADVYLKTILWYDHSLQYPTIGSIGADFDNGGYGLQQDKGWDGYKVIAPGSPVFNGITMQMGDIISVPTHEYDGTLISGYDRNGYPVIDNQKLGFYRSQIIGFDFGFRYHDTVGTWIAFQKTPASGVIINTASTNWCSPQGIGGIDGDKIKKITTNMINLLISNTFVFN